jgi:hypothetical protein
VPARRRIVDIRNIDRRHEFFETLAPLEPLPWAIVMCQARFCPLVITAPRGLDIEDPNSR